MTQSQLVPHGQQNPILHVTAAQTTARAVDGAQLVTSPASATTFQPPCGEPSPARCANWPQRYPRSRMPDIVGSAHNAPQ